MLMSMLLNMMKYGVHVICFDKYHMNKLTFVIYLYLLVYLMQMHV